MKLSRQTLMIFIVIILLVFIISYFSVSGIIMIAIPPHIKTILQVIFIASGLLLLFNYIKQPKPPHPPHQNDNYEGTTDITGTVKDYGSNAVGDIDKILLQQDNQQIWLHFPPHTAQQILIVAVKNTTVTAKARSGKKPNKDNMIKYELASVRSDALGKAINVHDIPPPPPSRGNEVEVKGNSVELKIDDKGHVRAFILAGKLIDLPPHTQETLLPLLKNAHQIVIKGYKRSASDGFINSSGLDLIKPYIITIDNISYVIQSPNPAPTPKGE